MSAPFTPTRALVVFSDAGLWWLRPFKAGFRHCFVAVAFASGWVVIDPLSHRTLVDLAITPAGCDLAEWYRDHGLTVVDTVTRDAPPKVAPWRPHTCVESVKRILGVHAGLVLTPWQLFNEIRRFETGRRGETAFSGKNTLSSPAASGPKPGPGATRLGNNTDGMGTNSAHQPQEDFMGGLFGGAPEPPAPPPMPAAPDPEEEARKLRLEAVARNRRGRAGMISGDERGVLAPASGAVKTLLGKTLLGE